MRDKKLENIVKITTKELQECLTEDFLKEVVINSIDMKQFKKAKSGDTLTFTFTLNIPVVLP
jgi:hypothetical protein